jgi:DNA-binding LytR/AlgR family response regulator
VTKIRAIIADDEEPLRRYLKSRLAVVWPELVLCGEATNGLQALELIRVHRPQIAFLDIKMPGLSGMEVARKTTGSCWVVFITAYDQYAVEAFETEAVDYMLKPVTEERLEKAVSRLKKQITVSSASPPDLSQLLDRLIAGLSQERERHPLKWVKVYDGKDIRLIPVDDVLYFKSSDKYTMIITPEGESLIRKPIKELALELDPDQFWQIHRGTIVNTKCIAHVSRTLAGHGVVRLKGRPETLKVSRKYMSIFKQM